MHRRCLSGVLSEVRAAVLVAATLIGGCSSPTDTPDALRLEALTATSLAGTVGEDVTPAPVVRVTNAAGQPMEGIAVSFQVGGGGHVANASAQTDAGGSATAGRWELGTVARPHTVIARAGDSPKVVFTAIAKPGPVAEIARGGGDAQTALVRARLSSPLRVAITDRFGNPVSPVSVTFAVISGGGSIEGSTAMTASDGIASSGAWTLGPTLGAQQVRAQAEGAQTVFTAYACDESCRQLLFVRGGHIFITTLLGNDARQLTSDKYQVAFDPAWSADGRRIAFARFDANGMPEIYLMDADGSSVVRRAAGFHSPTWSPDGRRLAVSQDGCLYSCEMFLLSVEEDGTPPVHVASMAADPAWSPDGKRIAFVSLSGDDGFHELQVMNADGSGVESITLRDYGAIYRPAWSPDGRRIAFSKCLSGGCNIFTVNSDGTGLVQLTTVGNAFGAAWSPDGRRIGFTLSRYSAGRSEPLVAYIAADGGGDSTPIVVSPGHSPAWRPGVGNRESGIGNR